MADPQHLYRFFVVDAHENALVAQIVDSQLQGETVAELMKLELLKIIDDASPEMLVLDFRNVKIVGTWVISCFLHVNGRMASRGSKLKLAGMSDTLRSIFKTLRLDNTVFQIFDTVDEALASPNGPITYQDVCGRSTPFDPESSDS
ncbi:MAG: STAS domain-containing protein [Planctomycetaceae bacterium]|nr:STAS domain-containing protein [Planctomycetaceae bacterium]